MTREEAINKVRQMSLPKETMDILEALAPELAESEDERIRKLLVWQVYRNIEDETNDLAGSVYDGIKGHDPDLEESIEDWKKCLAWLEKQKEPENTSASTMAPSCWAEEPSLQKEQKPAEWSEEDEDMLNSCISSIEEAKENRYAYKETDGDTSYDHEIAWLKSLRPSWKPSEV